MIPKPPTFLDVLDAGTTTQVLSVASLRLIRILAVSACIPAQPEEAPLDVIVNALHGHFHKTLQMSQEGGLEAMGDLLMVLRTIAPSASTHLGTEQWIRALTSVLDPTYHSHSKVLRPQLLVLQILQTLLPGVRAPEAFREEVVASLLAHLGDMPRTSEETAPESRGPEGIPVHDVGFDAGKCVKCTVEGGSTLVHGAGGRGYGLGAQAIRAGCYQWKVLIVKENRGNEGGARVRSQGVPEGFFCGFTGTCLGVSKFPVSDHSHRSTSDMWLYRGYSGSLYHDGESEQCLQSYTQGDYVTVVLDMEARTLSFGEWTFEALVV